MPSTTTVDPLTSTNNVLLGSALEAARARFTKRNPKSLESYNEALSYFPGGNTRTLLHSLPYPMTFASGHSCYLTSVDGDTYLDFLAEYTSGIYGHNHPVIKKAIEETLTTGWNYGGINTNEGELAKIVCERFHLDLVRFTNSGTEATMMALSTAINYTGRKKILVFSDGFHGSTINFPTSRPKKSVNLPHEFVVAPFNDISGTQNVVDSLPDCSLAAILVEPVQGAGGAIGAKVEFLKYLQEVANGHDAVFMLDETMTSRLAYNGQGAKLGIKPDLMTLGKWIGGGMTFGAFGGRREIMTIFDQNSGYLAHSGTFNNNVFSMAAGVAGCRLMNQQAIERLTQLGEEMKSKIDAVVHKHGVTTATRSCSQAETNGLHHDKAIMYIRGVGSMLAIHFSGEDSQLLKGLFFHHLLQENIYIASRGFISLCIDITPAHVDTFVEAVERFVVKYLPSLKV